MKRIYSQSVSVGLQRDLENEFQAPAAKIEIQIRLLRKGDVADLLDPAADPSINPRIIVHQQSMVDANIPTCYVAVTADNKPCYMQWLIGYDDNQEIEKCFKGVFPALKKTALLEGAYIHPAYRSFRIMPMAMSLIAEKAAEMNARWVNTFVDITNIPFLRGCQRAGFNPYLLRKDRWLLFHRTVTFHPISLTMNKLVNELTDSDRHKTGGKHQVRVSNHKPKSMST